MELEKEKGDQEKFGGFWERFVAFLIDAIVLVVINSIVAYSFRLNPSEIISSAGPLIIFKHPIFLITGWLYYAFMESSDKQATFGKLALNLKITDEKGEPINFGKATGRFFGKILSYIILYIGFIMIAFTKKKQGLHDQMASCLVIKQKN